MRQFIKANKAYILLLTMLLSFAMLSVNLTLGAGRNVHGATNVVIHGTNLISGTTTRYNVAATAGEMLSNKDTNNKLFSTYKVDCTVGDKSDGVTVVKSVSEASKNYVFDGIYSAELFMSSAWSSQTVVKTTEPVNVTFDFLSREGEFFSTDYIKEGSMISLAMQNINFRDGEEIAYCSYLTHDGTVPGVRFYFNDVEIHSYNMFFSGTEGQSANMYLVIYVNHEMVSGANANRRVLRVSLEKGFIGGTIQMTANNLLLYREKYIDGNGVPVKPLPETLPSFFAAAFVPVSESITVNDITYDNGNLTLNVSGLDKYDYQYWIKKKVTTDAIAENTENQQYTWELKQNFTKGLKSYTFDVSSDDYLDKNDCYSMIARVKNGVIKRELVITVSGEELGQAKINSVLIGGKNESASNILYDTMAIEIIAANADSYALDLGGGYDTLESQYGVFDLSGLNFPAGMYKITAKAINGISIDEYTFTVFIAGGYNAAETPVILSLDGESDDEGKTEFTVKIAYADGGEVDESDLADINVMLSTAGRRYTEYTVDTTDGLALIFNVDYNNKYGIYRTEAVISRKAVSGYDDRAITYYGGYNKRTASLEQGASAFEAAVNTQITIESAGSIKNIDGTDVPQQYIKYAYYREDASGWVLIRDYDTNPQFVWQPALAGIYNIQVRIMADGYLSGDKTYLASGSYEEAVTKSYKIIDNELSGNVTITVYDCETGDVVTGSVELGRAYLLKAEVGSDDALFRYTLHTDSLGTIYLNNFGPQNTYIFVPNKLCEFVISARAIYKDNYGYMDKSGSVTLNCQND